MSALIVLIQPKSGTDESTPRHQFIQFLRMQLENYIKDLNEEESHKSFLASDIEKEAKNSNALLKSNYPHRNATMVSALVGICAGLLATLFYTLLEVEAPYFHIVDSSIGSTRIIVLCGYPFSSA